ncbi:YccF domain-containing protein [Salinibaculum salinum]|uniref:YccF domain-containing protein n=1 Tax=Salinibaculum salinum TaxID=3131996 RepID=UPI0030EB83E7
MSDDTSDPAVNRERSVTVDYESRSPSLLVRTVYFLLIGWWLTGIWLGIAWVLNLTIVGMPLGIKMINRVPKVLSLKERPLRSEVIDENGAVTVVKSNREQRSLLVRAVYFLLVGWWASGIWMGIAYAATLSIVGLPLAVWMYGKLPFVVSLYNY